MQDLRMLIGGVVMLFLSAFLMAEHARAATESVQTLTPTSHQVQTFD